MKSQAVYYVNEREKEIEEAVKGNPRMNQKDQNNRSHDEEIK